MAQPHVSPMGSIMDDKNDSLYDDSLNKDEEIVEYSTFRLKAYDILEDLKDFLQSNKNGHMGTNKNSGFIIGQAQKIIDLFDSGWVNHVFMKLNQKVSELATKKDCREMSNGIHTCLKSDMHSMYKKAPTSLPTSGHFSTPSYRETLLKPRSTTSRPAKAASNTLLVYCQDESKGSEETKKILKEKINPAKLKVGVKGIRRIGRGGVAIDVSAKQGIVTLKGVIQELAPDLKTQVPPKQKPRIRIGFVPTHLTKQDFTDAVYSQNEIVHSNMSVEEFNKEFSAHVTIKNRDPGIVAWLVDVSPRIRKLLLDSKRVNIEWVRCPVNDHFSITQCFKCCGYGHISTLCTQERATCSQCGGQHHFKDCPNKNTTAECTNCKKNKNTECAHNAFDKECPTYKRMKSRLIQRTDYGE
ncbi:uncharacterized protein LOC111621492 [Centruroides sculpturatus]|uniref:uncharacterized protein LOC111621492 n=1 Tax=Centruroides sculpturatus TaxID=218467 RepID=UPI000C6CFD7D|nr:uncharacterized protein LOC111621492 [Centruroides sculpturatus]